MIGDTVAADPGTTHGEPFSEITMANCLWALSGFQLYQNLTCSSLFNSYGNPMMQAFLVSYRRVAELVTANMPLNAQGLF